jgi:hypothetical protein
MTLHEVERAEQFKAYYAANDLQDTEAKIDNLKKEMKIKAVRYDTKVTTEEILSGLEESVLFGNWKLL